MLHEWAHFDCTSPDKVRCLEDEMLQQVVTEASTTSKTNPATVAQPPHAGTEPENALSSEPAISSDADQTAGQKGAKKGTSKFLADFDIDALSSSWEEEAKSKLTKRGSRGQRMKPDPGEEMEGSSSDLEGRKGKGNGKGKGKGKGIGIGNAHLLGRDFDSREFRVEKVQPGSVLFVFGKMSSAPTAEVPELTTI